MKRSTRSILLSTLFIFFDIFIILGLRILGMVCLPIAIDISSIQFRNTLLLFLVICGFKIGTMFAFKVYQTVIKNIGIVESVKIILISLGTSFIASIVVLFLPRQIFYYPNEIFLFVVALEPFGLLSFRYIQRVIRVYVRKAHIKDKKPTLVIGAGAGGKLVLDETRTNRSLDNHIVVFVDDDADKIGNNFSSIPIEGPISRVNEIIKKYKCQEVIIAIADLDKKRLYEILNILDGCEAKIKRLPLMSEMGSGQERRVVEVDLNELLCRDVIKLYDDGTKNFICGKTVLVTGAGGSIGSELVNQIYKCNPKKMILLDIYENGVYDVEQKLVRDIRKNNNPMELNTIIGATYNEVRMESIFKNNEIDLVFHAAAYKHVPLMEGSPVEAIRSNVLGTYNIAKLCDKYHIEKMVLVSTDKAVRPTNVMGATKRFAELIIQYFDSISQTNYSAVRFGNVLGSNGSVIPLFKKQIEEGGPITVTDPRVTRFFMTIPEAVSLILQSAVYANGGEIFILDMGKPVRIVKLAEMMIRQMGYTPYQDMKIDFIGLRPGEKLYEELLLDVSKHKKTAHDKIFIEEKEQIHPIEEEIEFIKKALSLDDNVEIKNLLKKVIVTYNEPVEVR